MSAPQFVVEDIPVEQVLALRSGDFPGQTMAQAEAAMHEQWDSSVTGWERHPSEVDHGGVEEYIEHLAVSMREHGYDGPPIEVRKFDGGTVVDGHHRTLAAARAGLPTVPIRRPKDLPLP